MVKPNGYDEAQVSGERIAIELGGHYCQILQVSETKSSTGKDMIVVLFDFCAPDRQQGFFSSAYESDTRPKDEKKWPFAGSKYIMVNDYQDPSKTSRQFKTFCSCVEKSNNYTISWGGNNWGQQFKGKKIGAVYGEEENEYNGKTFMRETMKWFCNNDAVKDAKVPAPKYLQKRSGAVQAASTSSADDFMTIPAGASEEIPF